MGKINNVINKVKDFFAIWLNPNEEDVYETDKENKIKKVCEEYHMKPETIELLLTTYNGLEWTGYSEKEEVETKRKFGKGKNVAKVNSDKIQEEHQKQPERSQESSNNLER